MSSAAKNDIHAYTFGAFTLDARRGALIREGVEIKLRRQSFEVLLYLVTRAGVLVPREDLHTAVWGNKAVTDDSLAQCLIDIRKALGDSDRKIIRTMPRRGYLFDEPVTPVGSNLRQLQAANSRRIRFAGAAIALVATLSATVWFVADFRSDPGVPAKSIAVLPFLDLSENQTYGYFSDGLTEEILNSLTKTPDLLVTARTSSFAFRDSEDDVPTIASALGVDHVLEGSVRRSGAELRITAQLIRAQDGFHLWSESYDRTLDDIITIQKDIATEIASALQTSMNPEALARAISPGTETIAAYEVYLQGLEQQAIGTNDSLVGAAGLFEASLVLDPEFTSAAIALVRTQLMLLGRRSGSNPYTYSESADLLAGILAREPDYHAAQGLSLLVQFRLVHLDGDAPSAEDLIEQLVVHLSGGFGDSLVRREAATLLVNRGRVDEALGLLRNGLLVDPLNVDLLLSQAALLNQNNQNEEALQPLLTARQLEPANPYILMRLNGVAFDDGDVLASLEWVRQAAELDPNDSRAPANLAERFYVYGLLDAGDYWRHRALDAEPNGRVLATTLNMQAAAAHENGDEVVRLAMQVIDDEFASNTPSNTPTVFPLDVVVWYYIVEMHNRGRSREAWDYFLTKEPRLADAEWRPTELRSWIFKNLTHSLLADVFPPEEFFHRSRTFLQIVDDAGRFFLSTPSIQIPLAMWQGDVEAARTILIQDLRNYPLDANEWELIMMNPWIENMKGEPRVDARFAETIAAREQIKDEIRRMLQRPEWQLN